MRISLYILLIGILKAIECCHCPHLWEPVCATDAQLYSNMCFFMCARITQPGLMPQHQSACSPDPNAVGGLAAPTENEGNYASGFAPPVGPSPYEPDPTFSSPFGHAPPCTWGCRKAPAHSAGRICDDVGQMHPSECEFYKAVCRAEMGGYLLRRGPCRRNRPIANRRMTWAR